ALGARGLPLHCITHKRLAFAEAVLERAGIRARFALVLGGDSLPEQKPSAVPRTPSAARAGVPAARARRVGAPNQDLHAARAAGFRFAWVTYGYCKALDAGAAPPDLRLERLDELLPHLAG